MKGFKIIRSDRQEGLEVTTHLWWLYSRTQFIKVYYCDDCIQELNSSKYTIVMADFYMANIDWETLYFNNSQTNLLSRSTDDLFIEQQNPQEKTIS